MSNYVYGEVQANCDVQTMARVLENMVPEWKGIIQHNDLGTISLESGYEQAKNKYHIRVPIGSKGISYEDFGMRREGDKWVVAIGAHSSVAGKAKSKFESELPGEIGKLKAQKMINRMDVLGFTEEDNEDDFVFKFKVDGESILDKMF